MSKVRDVVCGMEIEETAAAGTAEHDGRTYQFCSTACRDTFRQFPQDYVGPNAPHQPRAE